MRRSQAHVKWKGDLLSRAVDRVSQYLARYQEQLTVPSPSLDVVIPTYRCDLAILRGICTLPVANKATTFIVIVDRPEETPRVQEELERLPRVQVRGNEVRKPLEYSGVLPDPTKALLLFQANLGACAARNRGLRESAAEWVLFLDDDILPERDLLLQYSRAIQQRPKDVHGLIGLTRFPRPTNLHTAAVTLSDVTYMFGIASVLSRPAWGVTANLLIKRREGMGFLEHTFPNTGGGEDVDLCLR